MLTYKDKTFCFSPDCINECGRQLTHEDRENANKLGLPIGGAFFCGNYEPQDEQETERNNE